MLLNPSGGLIYHWRALRFKNTLWSEFRSNLGSWLRDWKPVETRLLLVGPNAGYCLTADFLLRFKEISAVEPDPAARFLFARRFPMSKVAWSSEDYFLPKCGEFDPRGVQRMVAKYPEHAILFCNFLGQLPLLAPDAALSKRFETWKAALPESLSSRSWASFHDRLSGPLQPRISGRAEAPGCIPDANLVERFYTPPQGAAPIELSDHLTGDLFPKLPRAFFRWEISKGYWHLIEAVRHG
jgi:hypothetical protein